MRSHVAAVRHLARRGQHGGRRAPLGTGTFGSRGYVVIDAARGLVLETARPATVFVTIIIAEPGGKVLRGGIAKPEPGACTQGPLSIYSIGLWDVGGNRERGPIDDAWYCRGAESSAGA
jgi:hypothetical protein